MALTIIRNAKRAKIGSLELDASLTEQHTRTNDVTEHPVEKGANVADHKRRQPDQVVISGIVTNTPVEREQRERADAGTRAQNAYLQLLELSDSDELITVVTAIRTYENMAIVNLNVPRDAKTGDALQFMATLKEIRTVASKTVVLVDAKTSRAQGKAKKGKTATKEATEQQTNKSILKKAADTGIGDSFLKAVGAR